MVMMVLISELLVVLFTDHVDCHARYEEMVAKCQVLSSLACAFSHQRVDVVLYTVNHKKGGHNFGKP